MFRGRKRAVGELHRAALVLPDYMAKPFDFVKVGEAARDGFAVFAKVTLVGIRRKAKSARRQTLAHQFLHLCDLSVIRFALDAGFPHRVLANGAMADKGCYIETQLSATERIQVLSVGRPLPGNTGFQSVARHALNPDESAD